MTAKDVPLYDMHDKTFTRYEHMKANIYGNFKPSLQNGNSLQKNIDLKWKFQIAKSFVVDILDI